mmetsp:Transcript_9718/g.21725  ORF Transcript_9718/g.21725 Transcript_9718/m.21725 type:complete len:357 (+) Transcript_9718:112-1182(+)
MARFTKALLAAALMAISPEGASGTIHFVSQKLMKKLGWKPKKDHHQGGRRLDHIPEGASTGIWINELMNNVAFTEEIEAECIEEDECPPVGAVDFFEIMFGRDIDILDYTFTQYDAATGAVVDTYKINPMNFIEVDDFEPHLVALGVMYPTYPDVQGLSISKDCSGEPEIIECYSFGNTSFTGADGAECLTTGVTDPGFHGPIPLEVAFFEGMSQSREGFCPGGEWSLQYWSPFFYNFPGSQDAALEAFWEEGQPFPECRPHSCGPAVESCPGCKAYCEGKAGFDLEPYPHQVCTDCPPGRFQPAEAADSDAPNCEPSTGGWRCCVLSDFDGNKIYERTHDRCYCAGRRRTSIGKK